MPTILVVDDSAIDRTRVVGLLKKNSDLSIVLATNGKEALEAIEDHIPDIVFTDLQMPEMDGLELVAEIKKNYRLIPVILLTGAGSEEIAVKALEVGAASYVPKSRMVKDLVDTVRQVQAAAEEKSAKISEELLLEALKRLQSKAKAIGATLGKDDVHLANVNTSGYMPPRPQPVYRGRMMAKMEMAADMAAPVAEGGDDTVRVTVNATAVLMD